MVETIIVEFRILKDALVNGLTHLSISDKAVVAAITHPEEGILGFSLNNALNNADDSECGLSASYVLIIGKDITDFPETDPENWPVFYICCTEKFIRSVSTLPPRYDKFLDVVLYQITDNNTTKSGTAIYGEHNSHAGSIILNPSSLGIESEKKIDDAQLALYR